ncbi:carbamoyltransferase C-terminal domain-containing protein, partial [Streptomyces sp. ME19-01-6]|uniref:carbamoyltransferase C-terminal domain-containing protein n=1 Tax=Streptomyces sp. ME19-01-6 TaxID=3028686 RepID=UPI0029ADF4F7
VQTVNREQNPFIHDVLSAFVEATGVPILCNTSLHDKGEPIIDSISQAINFCLRKGVPVAYLNQCRVTFKNADSFPEEKPHPRNSEPFQRDESQLAELAERLNPSGLDDLYLHMWLRHPMLRRKFDPADQRSARTLKRTVDSLLAMDEDLRSHFSRWIDLSHNPRTRVAAGVEGDASSPASPPKP